MYTNVNWLVIFILWLVIIMLDEMSYNATELFSGHNKMFFRTIHKYL